MQKFQAVLIGFYGFVKKVGILDHPWMKRLFLWAYFFYKKHFEDAFFALTKRHPYLFQNGYILDVGANIGYTASIFSRVLSPGQLVYAFEPDTLNFKTLKHIIRSQSLEAKVVPICAAVGATDGAIELWHNQQHHGDHRIATQSYRELGVTTLDKISTVEMHAIDSFLVTNSIQNQVKFIKIDVQGYELEVCKGMDKTLMNNPDLIVAIEYAPDNLIELGFQPSDVLDFFKVREYSLYILQQSGRLKAVDDVSMKKALDQRGYVDLICSKQEIRT